MDRWINPPEKLDAEAKKLRDDKAKVRRATPARPTRDVLQYLLGHARLEDWQADCLSIVREESYYYAPQGMTKVMNEGWATYWHSTLMTKHFVEAKEIIDYADHHSGTVHMPPGEFQPVQDRDRAVPRHRGPLEQGQVRQGIRRGGQPRREEALGQGAGPRPGEDLRGPAGLQRRELHRRVHDAGVHREAQVLSVRPRPAHRPAPDRQPRPAAHQADDALPADQHGPAVHLRRATATTATAASCTSPTSTTAWTSRSSSRSRR